MSRLRTLTSLCCLSLLALPAAAQPPVPVGPLTVASPGSSSSNSTSRAQNDPSFAAGMSTRPGGFGPGRPGFPGPRPLVGPYYPGGFGFPSYGGYGYNYGYGGYGLPYYGYSYAPTVQQFSTPIGATDQPAPPLEGAGVGSLTTFKLAGMPAALNLQFPADATVWLNGRKVAGGASKSRDLASPPISAGTEYPFDVRAEWKADGKTYEYERTVKVPAGERSKITVLAGTPKK